MIVACVLSVTSLERAAKAQGVEVDDVPAVDGSSSASVEESAFQLTKDQKEALTALRAALAAKQAAAQKKMAKIYRRIQEQYEDDEDYARYAREYAAAAAEQSKANEPLQKEFDADLKSLLTAEQLAAWPKYERSKRRQQLLSTNPALAGDSIDLLVLHKSLKLPAPTDAIKGILERYELDMDGALVKRKAENDAIAALQRKEAEGVDPSAYSDPEFMRGYWVRYADMMKRARVASIEVRNINDEYAAKIANQLSEADAKTFSEAYEKQKFPEVFSNERVKGAIDAALQLDIPKEKKDELKELLKRYEADVLPLNRTVAREQAKLEANGGGGQHWQWGMPSPEAKTREDAAYKAALKAKRVFDRATVQKVRDLVGPDLEDRLGY